MPYIITTKRPLYFGPVKSADYEFTFRRAAATLKDMRQDARNIVEDHAQQPGWTDEWITSREATRTLPEGGGTITLPDGTVIEVERVSWQTLAQRAFDNHPPRTDPTAIIDAYNAAQS